ncbi:selenocysteine-specific translation elongation factor [Paraliobacillus sediminis]|uniref:selenocysteine-specific translation elongation factor n=1 Tax=Paraliobacillus sediminis TaxID=1885916 RepID=UPI000E3D83E0|nr:selenocysteine-specific translation elongation factor [Paraliobacillus sediminis]
MEESYYTIGMAGHIDHGKTTLTKALTNVDTDRLKEEKERGISITLGYAPIHTQDGTHVSIVDVPGHERFIRQMIAGVAGIDLVVLVIAADEGVMPQTREHIEILEFLGVKHAIIAVTKIDRVEADMLELVSLDIADNLEGTAFEHSEVFYVDSVSGKGIDQLKDQIFRQVNTIENRDRYGSFRMPIDQVFTVQGQGTIIRGTIYEGIVKQASQLTVLPSRKKVRARNIQVHNNDVKDARAGQRTAINLGGIDREEIQRGDVLVTSEHFLVTQTIDVSIRFVKAIRHTLKQRAPVKVHIGTSEVIGKIVFFDRNELTEETEEVLCQIRLDNEVVARRGDRFILRRPTPVETIGGGWVIDPLGEKYRFGIETIEVLEKKKQGSPVDLIVDALSHDGLLSLDQLIQLTSLDKEVVAKLVENDQFISLSSKKYARKKDVEIIKDMLVTELNHYHQAFPMRIGMNKAELIQLVQAHFPKQLVVYTLEEAIAEGIIKKESQFIAVTSFLPHLPEKWAKRMVEIIQTVAADGLSVQKWEDYFIGTPFSQKEVDELKNYLLQTEQAYQLTAELLVDKKAFELAIHTLQQQTGDSFNLKDAKEIWHVSRKYLIPLLELLDQLDLTKRGETKRYWI